MYDQIGVRVADRLAHLQKKLEPRFDAQVAAAAPVRDRFACHIFQRQIRLVVGADARIEQACDMRMAQAREDLPLAGEALAQIGVGQPRTQQFQRDPALVQPVGAARQPHLAHAAFAQQAVQLVRPDHRVGFGHRRRRHQRFGQKIRVVVFQRQQGFDFGRQRRIFLAQRGQTRSARLAFQIDQRVEQRRQALPAFGVHRTRASMARASRGAAST